MSLKPKRNWLLLIIIAGLVASMGVVGCGDGNGGDGNGELSGTITEAGSTTVQPLAEKLAEAFKVQFPKVTITIQGGGSSTGVKSAVNGTVDIGAASRELKASEEGQGLVTHLLCRDGIAIVVHPSNTAVTGLTTAQVKDIYAGNINNWQDVSGASASIEVIAREEGSGTRAAFEELVMDDVPITASATLLPSNGNVRTAVSGDPNAIGFLSFGYLNDSVVALDIDGVAGTEQNAAAGTYPIVRPLYFLTKGEPTGVVKAFIDFAKSSEGQAIAEAEGYIPVS